MNGNKVLYLYCNQNTYIMKPIIKSIAENEVVDTIIEEIASKLQLDTFMDSGNFYTLDESIEVVAYKLSRLN